jgi:hypothetical protein
MGEGLGVLAESVQTAMETLAGSLQNQSSGSMSPRSRRQHDAIAEVEENEELLDEEFNDAVILLTTQASVANSYLAIKSKAARTKYLQSQILAHIRKE